jgi:hypothetical protein
MLALGIESSSKTIIFIPLSRVNCLMSSALVTASDCAENSNDDNIIAELSIPSKPALTACFDFGWCMSNSD